jgi:hypothetical protein
VTWAFWKRRTEVKLPLLVVCLEMPLNVYREITKRVSFLKRPFQGTKASFPSKRDSRVCICMCAFLFPPIIQKIWRIYAVTAALSREEEPAGNLTLARGETLGFFQVRDVQCFSCKIMALLNGSTQYFPRLLVCSTTTIFFLYFFSLREENMFLWSALEVKRLTAWYFASLKVAQYHKFQC